MADPKVALAGIGQSPHPVTLGAPRAIKAIMRDKIKASFDPTKDNLRLHRSMQLDKKPSLLLFPPERKNREAGILDAEAKEDAKRSESLSSRRSSLMSRHSSLSTLLQATLSGHSSPGSNGRQRARSSFASIPSLTERSKSSIGSGGTTSKGSISTTYGIERPRKMFAKGSGSSNERFPPHGFRFKSNGDLRTSELSLYDDDDDDEQVCATRDDSLWALDQAAISFSKLSKQRAKCVKIMKRIQSAPAVHIPDPPRYTATTALRMVHSEQKRQAEEKATPGLFRRRQSDGVVGGSSSKQSKDACGGDTVFKQTILRHMRDMARSSPSGRSLSGSNSVQQTHSEVTSDAIGHTVKRVNLDVSGDDTESSPDLMSPQAGSFTLGNSSFNMRFGVPVKTMAQRKSVLDEKLYKELEKSDKNEEQIANYINGIHTITLLGL